MTCKLKSWRRLGASFLLISSIWKSPVRTKQATRGCHNEVDELRSSWDRFVQTAGECLPEETKLQSPDTWTTTSTALPLGTLAPTTGTGSSNYSSPFLTRKPCALLDVCSREVGPGAPPPGWEIGGHFDEAVVGIALIAPHLRAEGHRPRSPNWELRAGTRRLIPVVGVVSQALPLCPPKLDGIRLLLGLHVRKATTLGKGFATNDNTVSQAEGDTLLGATAFPRMRSQAKKS